jgi:hypothetical protein
MSVLLRSLTTLGVISFGLVSLAGYTRPSNLLEQHPKRVVMPAEPVSSTPKSDRLSLFDTRWDQMPTVAEIRVIPLERPELPPSPPIVSPEGQDQPGEPEVKTHHHHASERERRDERPKNVCERHHLRKVVTNGGRSWRCRR